MTPLPPISGIPLMPRGLEGLGAAAAPRAAEEATAAAAPGFAGALADAISGLNTQMVRSERLSEMAATGALADPTTALVEVEKADLAFNTAVQVRNKLVEGWQELSRMQV